jgi:hypothetical protein
MYYRTRPTRETDPTLDQPMALARRRALAEQVSVWRGLYSVSDDEEAADELMRLAAVLQHSGVLAQLLDVLSGEVKPWRCLPEVPDALP